MNKAESTRHMILSKAFELIYTRGYQSTSVDDIISNTRVTKGAFYYHFSTKDEMGIAIINEILKPVLSGSFAGPLQKEADPAVAIYTLIENLLMKDAFMRVEFGCPVSNLTQEMASRNVNFKHALEELTHQWTEVMSATIESGKKEGFIRKDVNAKQVTLMILSGYWGIRNFGRLEKSNSVYLPYLKELKNYLQSIK
jgi:TetR/AcrR family transcriptional repressor of nem operon